MIRHRIINTIEQVCYNENMVCQSNNNNNANNMNKHVNKQAKNQTK